jgi:hypothetical protein
VSSLQGAFDGVAPVHPLLESFGTLFLAPLLQKLVVLTHHEAAVLLSRRDTLFS